MLMKKVEETVDYIKGKTDLRPTIGLVLGSGLGAFAEKLTEKICIDYADIPHFMTSTAPGHSGRLVIGKMGDKTMMCMQGRFHYYEGYTMQQVTYPIRVMKRFGVEALILTNACGGLNPTFRPGDLMVVTDHINFMGMNPLIGANEVDFGKRFCDMSYAYDKGIRGHILCAAKGLGIEMKEGVYIGCSGPSFETPAEIRLFQGFGCSAVGMSTVPEVIVANHCGLKVAAISCVTNLAAGLLDVVLTEEEVIEVANKTGEKFMGLLEKTIAML